LSEITRFFTLIPSATDADQGEKLLPRFALPSPEQKKFDFIK
jgi:hypothetical protein